MTVTLHYHCLWITNQRQQTDGYLEVAAVASPESQDETFKDQLSDLREL